jgi:hypothetical protein
MMMMDKVVHYLLNGKRAIAQLKGAFQLKIIYYTFREDCTQESRIIRIATEQSNLSTITQLYVILGKAHNRELQNLALKTIVGTVDILKVWLCVPHTIHFCTCIHLLFQILFPTVISRHQKTALSLAGLRGLGPIIRL